MTFNPASATDNDQLRVGRCQFFCNYMHDFLYLLGFREADGNFQQNNLPWAEQRTTGWTQSSTRAQ